MYPIQRNRRLRSSATLRALVQEHHLSPSDFIVPLFVIEGTQKKEPIASMPGYYRWSTDFIAEKVKDMYRLITCGGDAELEIKDTNRNMKSKRRKGFIKTYKPSL